MDKVNTKSTPMAPTSIITKDTNGKERQEKLNYHSLIGMLNYLVNTTHPELVSSVHHVDPPPVRRTLYGYVLCTDVDNISTYYTYRLFTKIES